MAGTLGAVFPSCMKGMEIIGNPKLTGTLPEAHPLSVGPVSGVKIVGNGLTGEIPLSFLKHFVNQPQRIRYLNLSGNKFTSLPDGYGTLPIDAYYFIDISDNCLAASINCAESEVFTNFNIFFLLVAKRSSGVTVAPAIAFPASP